MSLLAIIARTALGLAPAPASTPARPATQLLAPAAAPAAPATTGSTAAASAADVVDHVQQFYAGIHQVSAKFRQSVTNDTFGSTKTSDGAVQIAKPGKMRWDYVEKDKAGQLKYKKSFISNGKYLYVVEHDNKQVVKKSLQQDLMPVAVSFLYGKGDLKGEFNAELDASGTYGGKGDLVLKLAPKQPSAQYKNLYLVVSPADYHVSQSIIVDSSNNVNHFSFYEPNFQTAIPDGLFEFNPQSVPSYRIIDADASKDGSGGSAAKAPPSR